jgi:protein-S-isoprenylcysteine O-methyltransferase Ste14
VTEWLAIGVGLAGGLLLSYWIGSAVLTPIVQRSRNPDLTIKLAFGGTAVAVLPALLLSIVVGAPLGMRWGAPGLVVGVALVFAVVLLAGTFAGALLARLLTRPGA